MWAEITVCVCFSPPSFLQQAIFRAKEMPTLSSNPASFPFFASSIFLPSYKLLPPSNLKTSLPSTKPSSSKNLTLIRASASTLPILSISGDPIGSAILDLKSAPPYTARSVVHRGLVTLLRNRRQGTASTLTRGEVRGGGRKPYPQKGTGRARRGSQRSPLIRGGGVIFGPKPKDWTIKINRKERRLALSTAIASAAAFSDTFVVEDDFVDLFQGSPKTRDFVAAVKRLGLDPKQKFMFFVTKLPRNLRLSCRNINTLKMLTPRTLNLFDVLDSAKLVLTKSAVDYLNSMYGSAGRKSNDESEDKDVEDAANADSG